MSALPRPDLSPGPARELNDALHELHHGAGWPSLRALARDAGVSHTTVSKVFSTATLPSWGTLELLVEAMSGSTADFHQLWLAATTPREGEGHRGGQIAGRKTELGAVRRHLEAGSSLLLVTGEAGIGKTKLVSTAVELVDGFVAVGTSLPLSRDVPVLPFADVLRAIHDVDAGQWLSEALSGSARYVPGSLRRLLPEVDGLGTVLADPDDDWSRQRLFTAVGSTLTALAGLRPLALMLEDLHWADPATLDLLEQLTVHGHRVPVVATYRVDDPATDPTTEDWFVRIRRVPTVTVLTLRPLSREDTTEQLRLLSPAALTSELADRIYAKSLGQPLFTEQLAAHADADLPLPSLLADLLERRLDGLGETEMCIVRVLAVADRPLGAVVLRAATGLAGAELTSGLRSLERHRLLGASDGAGDVRLRHPLLAEAIRRRLVAGEAVDLHRRLASGLGDLPGAEPAEVAAHWQGAQDSSQELVWRVRAAHAAAARFAKGQEAEHWLRILTLWPEGKLELDEPPVSLCDVYCSVIMAIHSSGDAHQAISLADEALALVPRVADSDAARLLRIVADNRLAVGGPRVAHDLVERAVALHEGLPPSTDQVLALDRRASILRALGRYADAAASVATAVDICESIGDRSILRWLLANLAWHHDMLGRPDQARARLSEALEMQPTSPDPRTDINLGVLATDMLLRAGAGAEEIEAAGRRGLDAEREWDVFSVSACLLRSNVAEALTRAGLVERAALLIDPVTEGPPESHTWAVHLERLGLDARRGRLEAADTRIEQLSVLGFTHHLENFAMFLEYAAAVDLWRGKPETAWRRCAPLLEEIGPTEASQSSGMLLVLAAAAAADLVAASPSRRDELSGALRRLHASHSVDPFAPDGVPGNRFAARATWAAELARVDGTPTVEGWVAAAAEWDKLARPHDAAYCRWRGAQAALRDGQGVVAARLLQRAAKDAREHVPLGRAIAATSAAS